MLLWNVHQNAVKYQSEFCILRAKNEKDVKDGIFFQLNYKR